MQADGFSKSIPYINNLVAHRRSIRCCGKSEKSVPLLRMGEQDFLLPEPNCCTLWCSLTDLCLQQKLKELAYSYSPLLVFSFLNLMSLQFLGLYGTYYFLHTVCMLVQTQKVDIDGFVEVTKHLDDDDVQMKFCQMELYFQVLLLII